MSSYYFYSNQFSPETQSSCSAQIAKEREKKLSIFPVTTINLSNFDRNRCFRAAANIQNAKGKAKPYQVRQVLQAIDKPKGQS